MFGPEGERFEVEVTGELSTSRHRSTRRHTGARRQRSGGLAHRVH